VVVVAVVVEMCGISLALAACVLGLALPEMVQLALADLGFSDGVTLGTRASEASEH